MKYAVTLVYKHPAFLTSRLVPTGNCVSRSLFSFFFLVILRDADVRDNEGLEDLPFFTVVARMFEVDRGECSRLLCDGEKVKIFRCR